MGSRHTDRRDVLKKAAVGGAIVWTAPVVLSGAAGAAGTVAPACTFEAVLSTYACGPELWGLNFGYDLSLCPGSIMQADAINGVPFGPICTFVGGSFSISGVNPFIGTWTVTLRDSCEGTVLSGPHDVLIDIVALCQPPGAPVDGAVTPADPGGTITISSNGTTIEVPLAP